MDQSAVVKRIERMCFGTTQAAVARQLGISKQYLCDILAGRREPGPLVLDAMDLERRVAYFPTNGS